MIRTADQYRYWHTPVLAEGSWGEWSTPDAALSKKLYWYRTIDPQTGTGEIEIVDTLAWRLPGYGSGNISEISFTVNGKATETPWVISCYLFTSDPTQYESPVAAIAHAVSTKQIQGTGTSAGDLEFTFENLSIPASATMYAMVGGYWDGFYGTGSTASRASESLAISGISPSTVGAGSSVAVSIANRYGQPITLTFKSGSNVLGTETVNSDSAYISTSPSWFSAFPGTTSLSVSVTAADTMGRTASGSFTLKQTLVATPIAPINRTVTGEAYFQWALAGDTSQTEAELYITDVGLVSVAGSVPSIYAGEFPSNPPPGTVNWRVRAKNNLGYWGPWSDVATYTQQYSSTSRLAVYTGKVSGSVDRFAALTFGVQMRADGEPYKPWTIHSPVFYWRQSASDAWTAASMTVQADEKTALVTFPANTFAEGSLYWKAEAQDQDGNTRSVGPYTLSTVAVAITATPTAPIDTIETSNTPTVFEWANSGTITVYPAGAELQYSVDGVSWESLATVTGADASCTVPAGTLPGGQIYWRVRVTNVDDVVGEWSASVAFQNFGAPSVSSVQADGKPYATITWTSSTQQAYRVTVDGVVYADWGPTVNSFTLPRPLADGQHVAVVAVQNEYGQWSQDASAVFTVENVPGAAILLELAAGIDAALAWSYGENTGDYAVYRDGVQIGHTAQTNFVDRLCIGEHSWYIIEQLPGGYYTKSNIVEGELITGFAPLLAPLSGGEWMPLTLVKDPIRKQSWFYSGEAALYHVTGSEFPVLETGPHADESVSDKVSLRSRAEVQRFKSMLRRAVIWKHGDDMLIGGLTAAQLSRDGESADFAFTIRRCEYEDFVNDTSA